MTLVLVMVGGAVGAPLRYVIDLAVQRWHGGRFPWGTFMVNVLGSLVLGAVLGLEASGSVPAGTLALVGTGLCGALTTYSTFTFETVRLVEEGAWVAAASNVLLSLTGAVAAGALGWFVVQAVVP